MESVSRAYPAEQRIKRNSDWGRYMYVRICIYIYVHPDMHMYMYIYIYIRTNTNIIIHVYVCMYREVLWGLHQELAMPVEGQVVQGLLWLTLLQNREMDHAETPAM